MNADDLIRELHALANEVEAERMARYHKVSRPYLGVRVPVVTDIARRYASNADPSNLIKVCEGLWTTNIHEARVLVGKLFDVCKPKETDATWEFINRVKEDLDAWAIADHLEAGARRCLIVKEARLDRVEAEWLSHPNFWVRRAALVYTLYLAKKGRDPERPLGWAVGMVDDPEWFIQKAIGWWLRELSKHNPQRVRDFLKTYGARMKPFARKEASKYLR